MENSKRTFNVAFTFLGEIIVEENLHISTILGEGDNVELIYSLQEMGEDNILDMKVGQSLYGKFRDSSEVILLTRSK
jgi:O-succinylbenzoate synthase